MIEAAEEAKRDSSGGREEFLAGGLVQKAVLLDLIHLTESADRASTGFKKLNPKIPWEQFSRLRNKGLVHDYAQVDLGEIWAFVQGELPKLRRQLDRVRYAVESDR